MNRAKNAGIKRAFGLSIEPEPISLRALLRPYRHRLVLGGFLLVLTNLVLVFLPTLINAGVSLLEQGAPAQISYLPLISFSHIYSVVALLISLAILGALIRTLSRTVIFDIGRAIERDVRELLFYRMSILEDDFYNKHSVGDILNHLTSDVTNVRLLTGFAALNIMNIIIVFLLTVPLLLAINPLLALCALLPFPLMAISMTGLSKRLFEASRAYQNELDNLVSHLQENLLGAHVVRLFHKQDAEAQRFSKTNNNTYKAAIAQAQVRALLLPFMRLVMGFAIALILWLGGQAIVHGIITAGDFVELNARILQLTWPAMSIGFVMSMYSRGSASIVRINELLSHKPAIKDGAYELKNLSKVQIKKLTLNNAIDRALSFSLSPGQMVAIVGMSGSYKTTLLKTIYGRIPVKEGTIFFDDHDINDLTLSSLYEHMSVVTQEPSLFHQSIKDNICFMRPDATFEEIFEVLRITRLDQDLKQFNDGLNTVVGERGITLSGGQRQRVALARALIAQKPLLILDDALSAVDLEMKQHIMAELYLYASQTMVIMATHNIATVENAQHIIVLDKGAVVAQGSFEDLLKNSDLFKELWGLDRLGRLGHE